MPKLSPEIERQRAESLLKPLIKNNLNLTKTARQLGVAHSTVSEKYHRPAVQKALNAHIEKVAKRVGINLTWLLKKYKDGADNAENVIGYLHQYKKENGEIKKAEPDEAVSNEFITTKDWKTQRLYMRDIAEIMRWIRTNGNDKGNQVIIINYGYRLKSPISSIRSEARVTEQGQSDAAENIRLG